MLIAAIVPMTMPLSQNTKPPALMLVVVYFNPTSERDPRQASLVASKQYRFLIHYEYL